MYVFVSSVGESERYGESERNSQTPRVYSAQYTLYNFKIIFVEVILNRF